MTDPMDTLQRMGAHVRSTDAARQAAHERLLHAMHNGEEVRSRRRSGRWRLAEYGLAVTALAIAAVVLLLARSGTDTPKRTSAAEVRSALTKSARLRTAPDLDRGARGGRDRLTQRTADGLARTLANTLPYPPGVQDDLRPIFSQSRPDMERTTSVADGESVAQYRAWCSWMGYWLDRQGVGDTVAERAAVQVLSDAVRWPTFRRNPRVPRGIRAAVRADDLGPVANQVQLNCRGVP